MIEIIPAIIPKNFQELQERLKLVEPFCRWVQIDVMDGVFVPNKTWRSPKELFNVQNLIFNIQIEAHLMIAKPEEKIDDWINSPVKRIIFHWEATKKHKEIIEKIKKVRKEAGIALSPETPIEVLEFFLQTTDPRLQTTEVINTVLIMTVKPGFSGQKFMPEMLEKIKALKKRYPDVIISVDGGINPENASLVVEAGTQRLAVGSYIWKSGDIGEAIEKINKAVN